jgi:hypothetical protein
MTGHPVLTLRAMRDRRAEDVMTGGLADFNRQVDSSKSQSSSSSRRLAT